jgi:hypothetical protein
MARISNKRKEPHVTTDPYAMRPEFYDALLALLLQARENARVEGFLLAAQVFMDAATTAEALAADLRSLAEGTAVTVPGEKTMEEVLVIRR